MTNNSERIASISNTKEELSFPPIKQGETEQVNPPYLVDKITEIALKNEGLGLIIGSSIATAIILSVITKSITEIIRTWKSQK